MKVDYMPPGTLLKILPAETHTIMQSPRPVGYWVLYLPATPCTTFAMYYKPTDEQIKNTEQLLGWGWRDA
jgi:hypothetical protein